MALHDDVHKALLSAGQRFEQHLTRHLQDEALQAGWGPEAARRIRAVHHNGRVDVDVEGAEDWEYGDDSRPPLAVGRQTLARLEDHEHVYERALLHSLRGIL